MEGISGDVSGINFRPAGYVGLTAGQQAGISGDLGGISFGVGGSSGSAPAQQGGGGGYSAPVYVDPYAKWGGQAAYNNLKSGFDTQKSNIYSSANELAAQKGTEYKNNILDTVHQLQLGQKGINAQAVQNEQAKRQGTQDVYGMVGRGIKSGGVMLANKNAGDSSAAGALAGAYGDMGRRQMSTIGNQYEAGNRDIASKQEEQAYQQQSSVNKFNDTKASTVNSIVGSARDQLARLDADMANASMPERINIEQEKEAIRAQALNQLQQYDRYLNEGLAAIKVSTPDERRAQAIQNAQAGVAPENAFQYSDQTPTQWQGTGPFASDLPIFTMPRGRRLV